VTETASAAPHADLGQKSHKKLLFQQHHPRIRINGLIGVLETAQNDSVAVIYRGGTSLKHLKNSLQQILAQLEREEVKK